MKTKTFLTSLQSITLLAAVLLSSAHAKDIAKAQVPVSAKGYAAVKTHSDDGSLHKIGGDHLHNHVDKQTLKTYKHTNNAVQYAERRSLALLERNITTHSLKADLKLGWTMWLRLAYAKIML